MIQTDCCPDKFGTYLSHPERVGRFERFLVKVMCTILCHYPKVTPQMRAVAERMSRKADFTNRDNIFALVEYVKAGRDVPME